MSQAGRQVVSQSVSQSVLHIINHSVLSINISFLCYPGFLIHSFVVFIFEICYAPLLHRIIGRYGYHNLSNLPSLPAISFRGLPLANE